MLRRCWRRSGVLTAGPLKSLLLEVGYSQSWVSNVLRRRQVLTVDQVREIARRFGTETWLTCSGLVILGGEDQTKRRDFGKAMALALVPLPMRAEVDETTAPILRAITGAQRRLDATASSRELARGVAAHVDVANRLFVRAQEPALNTALAAAVSEAAGFAAWLHADMYDVGTARVYYRLAIDRARRAQKGSLARSCWAASPRSRLKGQNPAWRCRWLLRRGSRWRGGTPDSARLAGCDRGAERRGGPRPRGAADIAPLRAGKTIEKGHPSGCPRGRGCFRSIMSSWRGTGRSLR